ncbi:MAG TPA: hypothetical protein VI322_00310 [Candidatus Saccharimonadia bacterium]
MGILALENRAQILGETRERLGDLLADPGELLLAATFGVMAAFSLGEVFDPANTDLDRSDPKLYLARSLHYLAALELSPSNVSWSDDLMKAIAGRLLGLG